MRAKRFLLFLSVFLLACFYVPSAYATTETRYFVVDSGSGYDQLELAYDQSAYYTALTTTPRSIGIRVYYMDTSDWVQHEVTSGSVVGIATYSSAGMHTGASWTCPETAIPASHKLYVEVYYGTIGGSWSLYSGWISNDDWGGRTLSNVAWTPYYYLGLSVNKLRFSYGSSSYPSRITNIQYTLGETTLNLYGTISQKFTVNKLNAWEFSRQAAIQQQFTITSTQGWSYGQILNLYGSIVQQYAISTVKAWAFSIISAINPTWTITSQSLFIRLLNFYGQITQSWLINTQRTWQFLLEPWIQPSFTIDMDKTIDFTVQTIINQAYTLETLHQFISGTIIDIWGSITLAFGIQWFSSLPSVVSTLILLVPVLLTPFLIMLRRRKRKS